MTTTLLFRSAQKMHNQLTQDIERINSQNSNILNSAEHSVLIIDETIRKLKDMVRFHNFSSVAEEIQFFKHIKPLFTSKFVFYATLISIESKNHVQDEKLIRKFYKNQLKKLNFFYKKNQEFVKYMKQQAEFNDYKYFTRNRYDIKLLLPCYLYDLDENFSTSHDFLVAHILANAELEKYFLSKLNRTFSEKTPIQITSAVNWTSTKAGLIELITALHHTHCFNGGNIEMSEVVKCFEKSFNIELGNFYKTIGDIKSRKNGRTKFLHLLVENLNQLFLDTDE